MNVGDRVKVVALGRFHGHTGVIARITQRPRRLRRSYAVVYRVTLDYYPFQQEGRDWGFSEKELEVLEKERERA